MRWPSPDGRSALCGTKEVAMGRRRGEGGGEEVEEVEGPSALV
jgi:hypothetical protein